MFMLFMVGLSSAIAIALINMLVAQPIILIEIAFKHARESRGNDVHVI